MMSQSEADLIREITSLKEQLAKAKDQCITAMKDVHKYVDRLAKAQEAQRIPGLPGGMRVKQVAGRILGPAGWENVYQCELEPIPASGSAGLRREAMAGKPDGFTDRERECYKAGAGWGTGDWAQVDAAMRYAGLKPQGEK